MRPLILALFFGVVVQPGNQTAFVGNWSAEVNGITFLRVELVEDGGRLTGTMGMGSMRVDADGNMESAEPISATATLRDLVLRNGVLSFVRPDGDDLDQFEMRLTGGGAQLTMIIRPELLQELKNDGIPQPRPITLKKSAR